MIAGRLCTRWGRGDLSQLIGELTAEGRLLGLFKNKQKSEVRPICISGALRRLLCRAYLASLTNQIHDLVSDHQLGVKKGGYEIGAHTMREHAKRAANTGEVILLLDFRNAFNSVDRNLMLRLCAAHLPELAKLAFWIYQNEPNLTTPNDKVINSSTGPNRVV